VFDLSKQTNVSLPFRLPFVLNMALFPFFFLLLLLPFSQQKKKTFTQNVSKLKRVRMLPAHHSEFKFPEVD